MILDKLMFNWTIGKILELVNAATKALYCAHSQLPMSNIGFLGLEKALTIF